MNYASSFNGKFKIGSETMLDNEPNLYCAKRNESEIKETKNERDNLETQGDFSSIKAKTQKILSAYYDFALKRTKIKEENNSIF